MEVKENTINGKNMIQNKIKMIDIFDILNPFLICFLIEKDYVVDITNEKESLIPMNSYYWGKNLFYLVYFIAQDNNSFREMYSKLMEILITLRSEANAVIEKKHDLIEIKKYNFMEELLKKSCSVKKMDYFHGKDSLDFCFFIDANKFEMILMKMSNSEPKNLVCIVLHKFFLQLKKSQRIISSSFKLYEEMKIEDQVLKKIFPIILIKIKREINALLIEVEGDFSEVEKKQLEVFFMRDGMKINEFSIPRAKRNTNEILISQPSSLPEGSYLIHFENSEYCSNLIKYFHHPNSPPIQKSLEINQFYIHSCVRSQKIIPPSLNLFQEKDLKQRNCAMIAAINGNYKFIQSLFDLSLDSSFLKFINSIDDDGNTCLHYCAMNGNVEILKVNFL